MFRTAIAASAISFTLCLAPALAGEGWVEGHEARVRLIAGPVSESGAHVVGIEIETSPGWHTYWRNPGDSGVPPAFDWGGSVNLKAASVEWPAPRALRLEFGTSIGYEDHVIFPAVLEPATASAPIEARLGLDYAVCHDVCIPVHAVLSARLDPGEAADPDAADAIAAARASVPVSGTATGPRPRIVGADAAGLDGHVVLTVETMAQAPAELFVEGPPAYYFSVPDAPTARGDSLVFSVEVDGAKTVAEIAGIALTGTLVAADGAVEQAFSVR